MNHKRNFHAKVTQGRIVEALRKTIADCIAKFDGKIITISIEEKKKQRSNKQNRFYRGFIVPAIKDWLFEQGTNLTLDETHDWVVKRVWKYTEYVDTPDGEPYEKRRSSTEPDTVLWEQFQDVTRSWFADKGLMLPFPQEYREEYMLAG
jgi:hypothetical protein